MKDKLQSLRGMKDLFGEDFELHNHIIDTARKISTLYCYEGASTPILEYTKVFDRTLGDTSDVVSKEMYSFLDRNGESIALRPEFTAGIIRAFIAHGLQQKLPLKLFSYGPVFRYDRPQAGRQRQFHQINYEYIGSSDPYSDAEIIKLGTHLLRELNILDDITLEINSLGCKSSRASYQQALTDYFTKYENDLSDDSKKRLNKNSLRILDSKDENDKKIALSAPLIANYYTPESKNYFDKVLSYLDILNIKYKINPRLARGLDYYCHTAFEFTTDKLGAQSTVMGGGRYDYLCELMGGSPTAAVGFASGVERLALMMVLKNYQVKKLAPIHLIPIGEECENYIIKLADLLRSKYIPTSIELKGKIQKRMERALKNGANYIVFAGLEEVQNNNFKLKILDKKEEQTLSGPQLIDFLLNIEGIATTTFGSYIRI
jgi:histidyl-tRNA synthetase